MIKTPTRTLFFSTPYVYQDSGKKHDFNESHSFWDLQNHYIFVLVQV